MYLYWTSLPFLEEGILSSSFASQAGIFFLPETVKVGTLHPFLCDYTKSRTFSLPLRSSPRSSEEATHPWN